MAAAAIYRGKYLRGNELMASRTYFLCIFFSDLCKKKKEQNTIIVQVFLILIVMVGFELC